LCGLYTILTAIHCGLASLYRKWRSILCYIRKRPPKDKTNFSISPQVLSLHSEQDQKAKESLNRSEVVDSRTLEKHQMDAFLVFKKKQSSI
jgi:hypothetical protein